ncbi:hypothetical protein [Gallibacterium anatis]|nr:hypothetical protein [Gallibacterium anatis]
MQGEAAVKWGRPLGEAKASMQGTAAVKVGQPLGRNLKYQHKAQPQ